MAQIYCWRFTCPHFVDIGHGILLLNDSSPTGRIKRHTDISVCLSSTDETVADKFSNGEIVINFWELNFNTKNIIPQEK